jgi:hypothetical protein
LALDAGALEESAAGAEAEPIGVVTATVADPVLTAALAPSSTTGSRPSRGFAPLQATLGASTPTKARREGKTTYNERMGSSATIRSRARSTFTDVEVRPSRREEPSGGQFAATEPSRKTLHLLC